MLIWPEKRITVPSPNVYSNGSSPCAAAWPSGAGNNMSTAITLAKLAERIGKPFESR